MSLMRTLRRQGLSTGSWMSSTTYASVPVDGTIGVSTKDGQRAEAASLGIASGTTRGAASRGATATAKRRARSCAGTRSRCTSPGIDASPVRRVSRTGRASPSAPRATVRSGRTTPRTSHTVSSVGPNSMCRTTPVEPSACVAPATRSRTAVPATWYSSTAPAGVNCTAVKRPDAASIGPRPTSSGEGAGSRGSTNDTTSPTCQPG